MISAVYLINAKGDIILYRKYRDDVARYVRSPSPSLNSPSLQPPPRIAPYRALRRGANGGRVAA